jgi:hypothetical protein
MSESTPETTEEEHPDVEAERERRLDPDNRPDNAEVDNSDAELPTVEEFARREAEDDQGDDDGGSADPSERFRELEVSEEERAEIEAERERRLDPDNRPDNAEVDNTGDAMPDIAKDENQPGQDG